MNERTFTDNLVSFHPGCSQAVMGGREAGRGTQLKVGGGVGGHLSAHSSLQGDKKPQLKNKKPTFFYETTISLSLGVGGGSHSI